MRVQEYVQLHRPIRSCFVHSHGQLLPSNRSWQIHRITSNLITKQFSSKTQTRTEPHLDGSDLLYWIETAQMKWSVLIRVYCKQTTNHQGSFLFSSLPSLIRGPHRRNLFLGDTLLSKGCLIGRISDRTCLDAKISHMKIVSGVNSPWELGSVRNSSYNPKFQSVICWVNSNLMIVIQKECFYQCSREINSRSSEFGILLSTWSLGSVLNSPDMKKFVFPIKQTLTVDGDANRSNINRSFA